MNEATPSIGEQLAALGRLPRGVRLRTEPIRNRFGMIVDRVYLGFERDPRVALPTDPQELSLAESLLGRESADPTAPDDR